MYYENMINYNSAYRIKVEGMRSSNQAVIQQNNSSDCKTPRNCTFKHLYRNDSIPSDITTIPKNYFLIIPTIS